MAYRTYHRYNDRPAVLSAAQCAYDLAQRAVNPHRRMADPFEAESAYKKEWIAPVPLNELKVAFLCDDFTWNTFSPECRAVFLTPSNWRRAMEKCRPDLFFCESAWYGISKYHDCWKNKVASHPKLLYENRRELFRILAYCRRHGIPTVFWNKEDPAYFDGDGYSFSDTARRFDLVLTTCAECIPRYEAIGARNVHLLPFCFSPILFHPDKDTVMEDAAVFAGSWYRQHPERCRDMSALFDMVLGKGIPLVIYDRNYGSANDDYAYPEKYRPYIKGSLPFEELGKAIRKYRYAINVNTVTDSETMFARRVFELMAQGQFIISNESPGMRRLFGDNVWYLGEDYDLSRVPQAVEANMKEVFAHHTASARLKSVCEWLSIPLAVE